MWHLKIKLMTGKILNTFHFIIDASVANRIIFFVNLEYSNWSNWNLLEITLQLQTLIGLQGNNNKRNTNITIEMGNSSSSHSSTSDESDDENARGKKMRIEYYKNGIRNDNKCLCLKCRWVCEIEFQMNVRLQQSPKNFTKTFYTVNL